MLFFYPWTAVIHHFDVNYSVCIYLWWVSSVPLVRSKIIDKEYALIAVIIVELIFVVMRLFQNKQKLLLLMFQ